MNRSIFLLILVLLVGACADHENGVQSSKSQTSLSAQQAQELADFKAEEAKVEAAKIEFERLSKENALLVEDLKNVKSSIDTVLQQAKQLQSAVE